MNKKFLTIPAIAAVALLTLTACGEATPEKGTRKAQLQETQASFDDRRAPNVTGDAEYNNYIKAQEEIYDNPASVIWCTVFPDNPSAPIFTVPIAGKLTSSSVSFYPNLEAKRWSKISSEYGGYMAETQSVDGMYHGSPASYRYGFTPGGMYQDFTDLSYSCSSQLTEFQRQTLKVAQVSPEDPTVKINELMEQGKADEAQALADSLAE